MVAPSPTCRGHAAAAVQAEAEWAEMCEHMGLSEVENTRISLAELRAHECWQHQRVGEGAGGSPKR